MKINCFNNFMFVPAIMFVLISVFTFATPGRWDEPEVREKWTELMKAVYNDDISMVENYIKNGVLIDETVNVSQEENKLDETSALLVAIEGKKYKSLRILLDAGASVNKVYTKIGPPLFDSVLYGNYETTKILLDYNPIIDIIINQKTVLIIAAATEDWKILKLFLPKLNFLINYKGRNGTTALEQAVLNGYYENVKLLIENGANKYVNKEVIKYLDRFDENDSEKTKENKRKIKELLK